LISNARDDRRAHRSPGAGNSTWGFGSTRETRRFNPDSRSPKNFEEALTSRERDRAGEFRAAQNRGNLGIDRRGECDHVYFFGVQ
jgi:hypothetical protein